MGLVSGALCHKTVGSNQSNIPTLMVFFNGRQGKKAISGPLVKLGLDRDGIHYVIAEV